MSMADDDPKMDLNDLLYGKAIYEVDPEDVTRDLSVRFRQDEHQQAFVFGHVSSGLRWSIVFDRGDQFNDAEREDIITEIPEMLARAVDHINQKWSE
jgi:hypothetical protein